MSIAIAVHVIPIYLYLHQQYAEKGCSSERRLSLLYKRVDSSLSYNSIEVHEADSTTNGNESDRTACYSDLHDSKTGVCMRTLDHYLPRYTTLTGTDFQM